MAQDPLAIIPESAKPVRVFTMCGHPVHSQQACGRCDGCRAGRTHIGHVLSAGQMVVAAYENDPSMLKDAIEKLRQALDWKTV